MGKPPPTWPQDKHLSLSEAFHFAACAKRIGKQAKQDGTGNSQTGSDDGGVELGRTLGNSTSPIRSFWEVLACVDGLCGAPLGMAAKSGFDATISWLCCVLTYGGQVVVDNAERRLQSMNQSNGSIPSNGIQVIPSDFDQRPEGYEKQETGKMVHPKPIPEVLETLKNSVANNRDAFASGKPTVLIDSCCTCSEYSSDIYFFCNPLSLNIVKHEISFIIGMLEYIVARLSSPEVVQTSLKCKHCQPEETMVGTFLNLHCGHNNPFSQQERQQLKKILQNTAASPPAYSN